MAKIKVRHLRVKPSGFYFEPSSLMKTVGFHAEALGVDLAVAVARCDLLNADWDRIRTDGDKKPDRSPKGTMARLIEKLLVSSEFRDKSTARQEEIEYSIKHILPIFGPSQVDRISPKHCEEFYDILRDNGSVHKAARVMKDLRYLFNRAMRQQLTLYNPALAVKVKQPPPRRVLWRAENVPATIEKAWDQGYRGLAVGVAILYDTSLSPVDVRKVSPADIREDHTFVERSKTGRGQYAIYSPETLELIRRYLREAPFDILPTTPIVRTRRGRIYSKDQFARDFRRIANLVGLPKNVQMRDLRRTAHTERLEGGANDQEAKAAIGNSIDRNSALYDTYSVLSLDMAKAAERKRREHKTSPKVGKTLA